MSDGTKIEWTEATWNPVTGCTVHSAGCTNCYAMQLAGTRLKHHWSRKGLTRETRAGPVWTGEVRFNEEWLTQPLRWQRARMIFVCAHADLFHEAVPDEWIDRVFAVMALAPQHTFQVLTKRPARMREYLTSPITPVRIARVILDNHKDCAVAWLPRVIDALANRAREEDPSIAAMPLPNVWLGVSVEDQRAAAERVPELLATPAAVRWISAEPLLGSVDLCREYATKDEHGTYLNDAMITGLDWIVCGGESGPNARPMHPDWARSLRDQSAAAGKPFFFKQWGEWAPYQIKAGGNLGQDVRAGRAQIVNPSARTIFEQAELTGRGGEPCARYMQRFGKARAGRTLDGREWSEFPA